jgi:hypothetical protein
MYDNNSLMMMLLHAKRVSFQIGHCACIRMDCFGSLVLGGASLSVGFYGVVQNVPEK